MHEGRFYVQVATPQGFANDAEMFKLAFGHDLSADAIEQLDDASALAPLYGWRTIAATDDARLAHAIEALIGRGIGNDKDAGMVSQVVDREGLSVEAQELAAHQLQQPEREYGDVLREAAEAVLRAYEIPDA